MATLKCYKTYNFRDKDPRIDEIRTMVEDRHASFEKIHTVSGVATATLYNWFHGKTRRPQNATMTAVEQALGYRRVLVADPELFNLLNKTEIKKNGKKKKKKA